MLDDEFGMCRRGRIEKDMWRSFIDRSNKMNLDSFVSEALYTQKGNIVSGHSPCSDHHPFVATFVL